MKVQKKLNVRHVLELTKRDLIVWVKSVKNVLLAVAKDILRVHLSVKLQEIRSQLRNRIIMGLLNLAESTVMNPLEILMVRILS